MRNPVLKIDAVPLSAGFGSLDLNHLFPTELIDSLDNLVLSALQVTMFFWSTNFLVPPKCFGPNIMAAAGVKSKDQDKEYPYILVKGRGPSILCLF